METVALVLTVVNPRRFVAGHCFCHNQVRHSFVHDGYPYEYFCQQIYRPLQQLSSKVCEVPVVMQHGNRVQRSVNKTKVFPSLHRNPKASLSSKIIFPQASMSSFSKNTFEHFHLGEFWFQNNLMSLLTRAWPNVLFLHSNILLKISNRALCVCRHILWIITLKDNFKILNKILHLKKWFMG